jgi:4-carboxymuconolactone decarboxylase
MRTDTPRLPPLKDEELDAEQEEILGPFRAGGGAFNVARAFVRHPVALKAFRVWAGYVMMTPNPLQEREREIMALRTAWDIKCAYVWSRHLSYAAKAGLTDEEVEALKKPIDAHPWSEADAALIAAADALTSDFFIPDDIWEVLARHFTDRQLMDAIFVVGHFVLMGSFINAAGVPMDSDVPLDPDLDMRPKVAAE